MNIYCCYWILINICNISFYNFCSLTQNFTFTICFFLHCIFMSGQKLTTQSDLMSYCSMNTESSLSKLSMWSHLVASPNIPSNSIARPPSAKLKISLKTHLPNTVCSQQKSISYTAHLYWLFKGIRCQNEFKTDRFYFCWPVSCSFVL
jgi:hypothetical protein